MKVLRAQGELEVLEHKIPEADPELELVELALAKPKRGAPGGWKTAKSLVSCSAAPPPSLPRSRFFNIHGPIALWEYIR